MTTPKPALLWHSNAPHAGTGYAQQTALFTDQLSQDFSFGISAFYGIEGAPIKYRDVPVYPALGQTHGNETILDHARVHFEGDLRGGLTVSLMDVWVLNPSIWGQLNLASWVPIDHSPCPPPVASFLHASQAVPIAMSKFGREQLRAVGLDALYVPHGVAPEFKPMDREESCEALGLDPNRWWVGIVAANKGVGPSRKSFPEALEAFAALLDQYPDTGLYLHSDLTGRFGGVELPGLIDALGIPRENIVFMDQYRAMHYPVGRERLARVYNALDVLLMPSMGEGFGIPAIESQACGTPVIGTDFSAQPEVIGSGWLVEGQRFYTALKSWQTIPSIPDIADALVKARSMSEKGMEQMAEQAVAHAADYAAAKVYSDHLLPALQEACERTDAAAPIEVAPAEVEEVVA